MPSQWYPELSIYMKNSFHAIQIIYILKDQNILVGVSLDDSEDCYLWCGREKKSINDLA